MRYHTFAIAPQFQFHKGTIKPSRRNRQGGRRTQFQFHKGTIKPSKPGRSVQSVADFNSIKVRLNLIKRFTNENWKPISIP